MPCQERLQLLRLFERPSSETDPPDVSVDDAPQADLVFLHLSSMVLFITLRPSERRTPARKYNVFCCQCMRIELAVCVSLLESATPWL